MLLSRILRRYAVVFAMLTMVSAGAVEKDMTALLPRYAAMVAGVDLCALNNHPQGGEIFDVIQLLSDIPLESVHQAFFACDASFRRRVSAAALVDPGNVSKLLKKLEHRKTAEKIGKEPVYLIHGELGERNAVRLIKLDESRIGVYFRFPANKPFSPDCSGIPAELEKFVPRRGSVLGFLAGIPQSQQTIIRDITIYHAALENGVDDKLILHGKIIFKDASSAASANILLPHALALILFKQSQIPIADTLSAFTALNLQCKNNIIYFSCKEFVPLLKIFIGITHGKIPSIQMVMNEKQS